MPGLELDTAVVESVLTADDQVAAGIAAAVRQALALLAVDGVRGVNLSGMASDRGVTFAAEVQAEIGHRIRSELAVPREVEAIDETRVDDHSGGPSPGSRSADQELRGTADG